MAAPHTLKVGDTVTHPEWPAGTTRRILSFSPFMHANIKNGRYKLTPSPTERSAELDAKVDDGDGGCEHWMEAGLELAPGAYLEPTAIPGPPERPA